MDGRLDTREDHRKEPKMRTRDDRKPSVVWVRPPTPKTVNTLQQPLYLTYVQRVRESTRLIKGVPLLLYNRNTQIDLYQKLEKKSKNF